MSVWMTNRIRPMHLDRDGVDVGGMTRVKRDRRRRMMIVGVDSWMIQVEIARWLIVILSKRG